MKEFEGFLKMTQVELEEKKVTLTTFTGNAPYKEGTLCLYEGKLFIASQNTICSPTTLGN